MRTSENADRIVELEAELLQRDDKIRELTRDRDEVLKLTDQMRDQIEDYKHLIEEWEDAFEMRPTANGRIEWGTAHKELLDEHIKLIDDFIKLVRRHNRLIAERYPRPIGRPLAASEAQRVEVLKQRKGGASLRGIAGATGLGIGTVRTIVAAKKRARADRRREFDKRRAAAYRARQKARDRLPEQIIEVQKTGEI